MEPLTDDIRVVLGQIAYQRACQRAAIAGAELLTWMDVTNTTHSRIADGKGHYPAGYACRWQTPRTESAMCELRAALADMPTV